MVLITDATHLGPGCNLQRTDFLYQLKYLNVGNGASLEEYLRLMVLSLLGLRVRAFCLFIVSHRNREGVTNKRAKCKVHGMFAFLISTIRMRRISKVFYISCSLISKYISIFLCIQMKYIFQ